jgi:hypothetical protein
LLHSVLGFELVAADSKGIGAGWHFGQGQGWSFGEQQLRLSKIKHETLLHALWLGK